MESIINLEDVLSEANEMPSAYVHLSDWFCVTWHCSHIRYVSLHSWKKFELAAFLASIFRKDPSHPQLSVDEWLPNCELIEIGKEEIEKWISHAKSDYDEESLQESSNVEGTQFPIPEAVTRDIKWAYEFKGIKNPCNKHLAGPTYIIFWKNGEWFCYLEIHNES